MSEASTVVFTPIIEEEQETLNIPEIETSDIQQQEIVQDDPAVAEESVFDLPEIKEVLDSLPTFNYIELLHFQKDIETELENLVGAMNLMNSIENMDLDEMNRKIALESVLQDKEFKEDAEKFKQTYPASIKKLTDIKTAVAEELMKYDGVAKGSRFLTDQMLDNLHKSMAKVSAAEVINTRSLKILEASIGAYTHRESLEYLYGKAQLKYVIKELRQNLHKRTLKCIKFTKKEFLSIFSDVQTATFEKYVTEIFEGNESATNVFIYHLAKIINSERNTGKYNYVKALVMNVLDIQSNVYDLDGGKEAFDFELHKLYPYYK